MKQRRASAEASASAAVVAAVVLVCVVSRTAAITIEPDGTGLSFPHRTAGFGAVAGRYMVVGPIVRATAPDARLCRRPTNMPDADDFNAANEPIRHYFLTKSWGNSTGNGTVLSSSSTGSGPTNVTGSTGGIHPNPPTPPNNTTGSSTGGVNPNPPTPQPNNSTTSSTGGSGPVPSSTGNPNPQPPTNRTSSTGGSSPAAPSSTGSIVPPNPPNNRTSSTGGSGPSASTGSGPNTSTGSNPNPPTPPNNTTGSSTGGVNPNPPLNVTSSTGGVNPSPPTNGTGSSTGGVQPNPPTNRTSSTGGRGPSSTGGFTGGGYTGSSSSSTGGTPYVPTGANNGSLPSIPITFGFIVYAQRGDCTFLEKARWAQSVGAAALIIGNTDRDDPILMLATGNAKSDVGAAAADITIPVVSVGAASFEEFMDAAGDDPVNLAYRGDMSLPSNGEGDPLETGGGFRSGSGSASGSGGLASWLYFVMGAAAMVLLVCVVAGVVVWRMKRKRAARRTVPAVAAALAGVDVEGGAASSTGAVVGVPANSTAGAAVIIGEPSPARSAHTNTTAGAGGVPGGLKHWDSQRRPSYSQSSVAAGGVVVVNSASRYGYPLEGRVVVVNTNTAPNTPTTNSAPAPSSQHSPLPSPHVSTPLPAYPNGTPYPVVPAPSSSSSVAAYQSSIVAPAVGAYHPAHNAHAEGTAVVVLTMGNAAPSDLRDHSPSTSLARAPYEAL